MIKQTFKRGHSLESIIDHMKSNKPLLYNYLKIKLKNHINILLCIIGHNSHLLLRFLEKKCFFYLFAFIKKWIFSTGNTLLLTLTRIFPIRSLTVLLFITAITFTHANSRRFYVRNMSNIGLYVYFVAWGCAGISGKHGCKSKRSSIGFVCAHKYMVPGELYSHKFMEGKHFLAYVFCLPDTYDSFVVNLDKQNNEVTIIKDRFYVRKW